MSEQENIELDLDELIIALEHSTAIFDEIDTSSIEYQAAQKLKLLQAAFNDGFELAEYTSYSEIVGQVQGNNRSSIREFCDKVFAHNRIINP